MTSTDDPGASGSAGAAPPAETSAATSARLAPLWAVLGAKGGCGATLVAAHLAAAKVAQGEVYLVDLDTGKGDLAGYLDLRSSHTLNALLERLGQLDGALLEGACEVSGGVRVLAQPYELSELQAVAPDEVRAMLAFVRAHADLVIADLGSGVDAGTLAAIEVATHLVLVVTPDIIALRDAQRLLRLLHRLGVDQGRVRLVVNRAAPQDLSAEEIDAQLGVPVVASLPLDLDAGRAATREGGLLSASAPRSALYRGLQGLWGALDGSAPEPPRAGFAWPWARP
jgi:pilus assembly protein CpaE